MKKVLLIVFAILSVFLFSCKGSDDKDTDLPCLYEFANDTLIHYIKEYHTYCKPHIRKSRMYCKDNSAYFNPYISVKYCNKCGKQVFLLLCAFDLSEDMSNDECGCYIKLDDIICVVTSDDNQMAASKSYWDKIENSYNNDEECKYYMWVTDGPCWCLTFMDGKLISIDKGNY